MKPKQYVSKNDWWFGIKMQGCGSDLSNPSSDRGTKKARSFVQALPYIQITKRVASPALNPRIYRSQQ
jgi:hypothetical protein